MPYWSNLPSLPCSERPRVACWQSTILLTYYLVGNVDTVINARKQDL
jgi:hypothetical protein